MKDTPTHSHHGDPQSHSEKETKLYFAHIVCWGWQRLNQTLPLVRAGYSDIHRHRQTDRQPQTFHQKYRHKETNSNQTKPTVRKNSVLVPSCLLGNCSLQKPSMIQMFFFISRSGNALTPMPSLIFSISPY